MKIDFIYWVEYLYMARNNREELMLLKELFVSIGVREYTIVEATTIVELIRSYERKLNQKNK